ncbi:putative quinol monooxygenase [Nocardioides speluncae]|uniref:putative quinol monooxygenase n=1 Tax=Nocardioides speluncae TaxID=2670337 RepID=UPI000D6891B0|nr:antibiotic biosynthesis monooxygenase family protein [Nocardioides speluncae]
MVIVAGHIEVSPIEREAYLLGCTEIVDQARNAPGCLDFSLAADLVDPSRINIYERWDSQEAVEDFRGGGPSAEQTAAIVSASVAEYRVTDARLITS